MNAIRFFILGLVVIGLAACASPQPSGKPPVLDKLRAMGIDPSTYTKIANHRVLSYDDIYGLVKKGVPGPVIVTYLQSTHAPYQLTDAQLYGWSMPAPAPISSTTLANQWASSRLPRGTRRARSGNGNITRSTRTRSFWDRRHLITHGRPSGTTQAGWAPTFDRAGFLFDGLR